MRNLHFFFHGAVQFLLPSTVPKGSLCSITLLTLAIFCLFDNSHTNSHDMLVFFFFFFAFPRRLVMFWAFWHIHVGHLFVFFGKTSFWVLSQFFNRVYLFCYWVVWVPYISWIKLLIGYVVCKYFPHFVGFFILLIVSFAMQKPFSLV